MVRRIKSAGLMWVGTLLTFLSHGCHAEDDLPLPDLSPLSIITQAGPNAEFRFGFAAEAITPTPEMMAAHKYFMAGFDRGRQALGVHDDIWARTVVFEVGGKRVAIAALDLIGIHHPEVEQTRQDIAAAGLAVDYLVLHATHNHEAPDTLGIWGPLLWSGHTPGYRAFVRKVVVKSVRRAIEGLTPATMEWSQAHTNDLGLVKDFREPQVVPDQLTLLQFKTAIKPTKTLASVVHWHCHPEAMARVNPMITSDYPHYLRTELERLLGGTPVVYWTGVIGGLLGPQPVLHTTAGEQLEEGTWEHAEHIGLLLAERAFSAIGELQQVAVKKLLVVREIFDFQLDNTIFKFAYFIGALQRPLPSYSSLRSEVAQLHFGDLVIQTVPGELYPELAYGPLVAPENADFPAAAPEEPILVEMVPGKFKLFLGLAQDEIGYIIPKMGWDESEPYLPDSYGEEVSLGINTAARLHQAVKELSESAVASGFGSDIPDSVKDF